MKEKYLNWKKSKVMVKRIPPETKSISMGAPHKKSEKAFI